MKQGKRKKVKVMFGVFVILLFFMSIGYSLLQEEILLTSQARMNTGEDESNYELTFSVSSCNLVIMNISLILLLYFIWEQRFLLVGIL